MIPYYSHQQNYSSQQNPDYSIQYMQNLADEWFEASKNNLSSNEAQKLYIKTGKVVSYIQILQGKLYLNSSRRRNHESNTIIEKINTLSNAFINGFSNHEEKESNVLAQWVAEHTGLHQEYHKYTTKYQGAYASLHYLVKQIKSIKTEYYQTHPDELWKDNSNLAYVDSTSKSYIEAGKKIELPDQFDIKVFISEQIEDLEELLAMRATSKENRDIVDRLLINRLNDKTLTFEDLNIHGFNDIFYFFGDRCSELLHLNMGINNTSEDYHIIQIINQCPNIDSLTLTEGAEFTAELLEALSKLKTLKAVNFVQFNDIKAFKWIIQGCLHLETISINGCDGIKNINILDTCKNLKQLYLTGCKYTSSHLTLKNCPLKLLEISECFIENIDCPTINSLSINKCPLKSISCPELQEIVIHNCTIKNPEILKKAILLNNLVLTDCKINEIDLESCPELKRIALKGCKFKDLYFLQNLSSLRKLHISNCPISSINVLQYLRSLETFEIKNCKQVTRIEVLKDCKALKRVKLQVNLPEDTLEEAINYVDILKELRKRGIKVTDR